VVAGEPCGRGGIVEEALRLGRQVGLRAEKPGEVDDVIARMLAADGPVIVDVVVDKAENCFPMIPSGRPHNEMLLSDESTMLEEAITEEGKMLV
jgi:acetolactate synthase-1/2/3 large subunit